MVEFNDEYFLNLTMKYDERDDNIYPKWAVWCANSNGRYYIDGENGHFYTHIRTSEEIETEAKRSQINEILCEQKSESEDWFEYEEYIRENTKTDEELMQFDPLSYEDWKEWKEWQEWKKSREESAE